MKIAYSHLYLSDAQWAILEPMLPPHKLRGRPRTPLRRVLDAIFYVAKSGCQWRLLPGDFPPWKTVYHHFRRWTLDGTWWLINEILRGLVRNAQNRRSRPTVAIIDSQTVRSDAHGGEASYDAAKKTKGRKRFLCVDSLGLVLDVVLLPAGCPEREGAKVLLEPVLDRHGWLRKIWADGGFSGREFAGWVRQRRPRVEVEVVSRVAGSSGFQVLPRRWVVERTFAWLCQHRRLVRDYEKTTASAAAWVLAAMTRVMIRRLA
jgi:transposase